MAWKPALRAALLLAVPVGIFSSGVSPLGFLGLVWMGMGAAWAVALYVRSQRPAWITIGAGARIGLVTGLIAAWLAFSVSGGTLLVQHLPSTRPARSMASTRFLSTRSADRPRKRWRRWGKRTPSNSGASWLHRKAEVSSPEGPAGFRTLAYGSYSIFMLLISVAGGAIGARFLGPYPPTRGLGHAVHRLPRFNLDPELNSSSPQLAPNR